MILELVQFRRGCPGVAIQAHALTVGGLTDHQHQGRRRVGHCVLQVVQRWNLAGAIEHVLHAGQGFQVAVIGHGHLPWHRRLDAGFELVEAFGETAGACGLLDQRITDDRHDNGHRGHDGLATGQVHRAQACPQEPGKSGVCQERRHHPPGKVLGHVFAGFSHVRLKHDEDDALGKLLLINEEVTQARHGARPQYDADHGSHDAGLSGEQQHRRQPEGAHDEGLAESAKAGGASQLDE
ncbi:hypothetical protein D9M69_421930 [compost metagenome]